MARIALTLLVVTLLAMSGVSCGSDDGGTTELPKEGLVVKWSIDTSTDQALCTRYGVANWSVSLVGPSGQPESANHGPVDVPCAGEWSTGTSFSTDGSKLFVGLYDITIAGKDAGGAEVASKKTVGFRVNGTDATTPDEVVVGFQPGDLP